MSNTTVHSLGVAQPASVLACKSELSPPRPPRASLSIVMSPGGSSTLTVSTTATSYAVASLKILSIQSPLWTPRNARRNTARSPPHIDQSRMQNVRPRSERPSIQRQKRLATIRFLASGKQILTKTMLRWMSLWAKEDEVTGGQSDVHNPRANEFN